MIDMPAAVADRLRQHIDGDLGVPPGGAEAPKKKKQTRLPARIVYGPTAEHIDDPWETDEPGAKAATSLAAGARDTYSRGYSAVVYLAGDGALVLGSGKNAREVSTLSRTPPDFSLP